MIAANAIQYIRVDAWRAVFKLPLRTLKGIGAAVGQCGPVVNAYALGCGLAVRTLNSMVRARIPTTTPSENSTGIL